MQVSTSYIFDADLDTFEGIMIDPKVIEEQVAQLKNLRAGRVRDLTDDGPLRTYTLEFVLGIKLPGATDFLTLEQKCTYNRKSRQLTYDVEPRVNLLEKAFDLRGVVSLHPDGPGKTRRDTVLDLTIHVPGLRQLLEYVLKNQFESNEQIEMEVLTEAVARYNTEHAHAD